MPMSRTLLLAVATALSLTGCRTSGPESGASSPENEMMSSMNELERTPAWIRENGNHLATEPSLYLRQHAHNPLDWYPWGEAALEKARAEDKPIFLSIGYSSCHWCHVMEQEVFEHDDVAAYMNEHFVCIKVDREERPDLDKVYMDSVQLMTGRGGWPMSVFLTPDGRPFHGGTYFPKPQFMQLVQQIAQVYAEDRAGVERQAQAVAGRITSGPQAAFGLDEAPAGSIRSEWIDTAVENAKRSYDAVQGGLQQQQKFPTPVKWRFLLHEYRRGGDPELGEMIAKTCEAMAGGGIYDHVGGGFHRYTVDSDWTVPHFEKMLYDNGQLAGLMIEAGVALERPDFTAVGLDVLDFLMREMRSDDGAFYASFDADSGGEEGSYYVWSRAEIAEVVDASDAAALADLLGVSESGNFEHTGKSVLTWRSDRQKLAAQYGRSEEDLGGLLARYREVLREKRAERTAPGLDRKVVVSWNGLVIASLAQAYAVTRQPKYLSAAEIAADFLLKNHRAEDGSLWRASTGNRMRGRGILDDYAFLADALLELYQVSGETRYLAAARDLLDHAIVEFGAENGGYYLAGAAADVPLGRATDVFDSVEPSGAAMMTRALVRCSALTGETKYRDRAQTDVESQAALLERGGLELAWWLDTAILLTQPLYDVVVAGDADDQRTTNLVTAVIHSLPPNAVLSRVPAPGADDRLLALAPALEGKTAAGGIPTAYVCEFGTCQAPTSDPVQVKRQLSAGSE